MDANGVLNITVKDKGASGKSTNIIHSSKEDIDRMMKEGETYADEDSKVRERLNSEK